MSKIIPITAFQDNYIWALLSPDHSTLAVVDPGDPAPVFRYLMDHHLRLSAILVTHHHHDHSGGIQALSQRYPEVAVYGGLDENIAGLTHHVNEGEEIRLFEDSHPLKVLSIPGHTRGHLAYYNQEMIFCGDTLFSSGCGRLFEGTAEQLFNSLSKINQLPGPTKIFCGHEYTLANLRFAKTVEPNNEDIQRRYQEITAIREKGHPSLPSTLDIERLTNPFLRCTETSVRQSVERHFNLTLSTPLEVFTYLRRWKDVF